jgi:hypothetical protein
MHIELYVGSLDADFDFLLSELVMKLAYLTSLMNLVMDVLLTL